RAARAALLPVGPEHEVIDDELAPSAEQVGERRLPARALELVALLDLHPRQLAALTGELLALAREPLFVRQKSYARCEPLVSRHDPVGLHRVLLRLWARSFAASAVTPPAEVAPTITSAVVVRHTGHMASGRQTLLVLREDLLPRGARLAAREIGRDVRCGVEEIGLLHQAQHGRHQDVGRAELATDDVG